MMKLFKWNVQVISEVFEIELENNAFDKAFNICDKVL